MHHRVANLLVLGLLAVACGSPAPTALPTDLPTTGPSAPPDFEIETAQFVTTGGCGDAFFWATNAAGTAAITVEWLGAASQAWMNDSFEASKQLPNSEITVSVVEGKQLSGYWCNDVRMPGQGPTSTIEASTGTVDLSVTPNRQGFEPAGQADLRLSNVTFNVTLGSGQTWHLDELVIEDVSVGWFAG